MSLIYKYPLKLSYEQNISMPNEAIILDIMFQDDKLMLWAIVNPTSECSDTKINIFGTGQQLEYKYGMCHLKTIQDNHRGIVWHIFKDER